MSKCPFHAISGLFTSKAKESNHQLSYLSMSEQHTGILETGTDHDLKAQIRMIDLTEPDLRLLKAIQPLIEANIDEIVSSFYQSVTDVPQLKGIIDDHSTVERLRQTLRRHLLEMFDGTIDQSFVAKRLKIAQVHQRIGLEPKWYMGAFQNLQNALTRVINREITDRLECLEVSSVINKLLNLEQQVVLDAYEKENMRQKEAQYNQVKEELKNKIASVSEDLAALTEETSASVQELVATSGEVNNSFIQTADNAKETTDMANEGKYSVEELNQTIARIQASTVHMEQAVAMLSSSSGKIRSIVDMVQEISNQTKLLSLNAAIEAARAGEHGRGFSVVAGEVQKLADDTKNAVEQISQLIQQSGTYTSNVVEAIQQVQGYVAEGEAKSAAATSVFGSIIISMENSQSEIQKVKADLNNLVIIIEEIGTATYKVATSAEHLNQTTREI